MSLKFTGDLCIMTMKNDVKFELKLTGQFKTDMSDLTIFDSNTQNLNNLRFNGLFLTKLYNA